MPFNTTARQVTVLVVDAAQGEHPYGQDAGADVARHLPRRGARVDVEQVSSEGKLVAVVILSQAAKHQADLIVVGARSHA